MNASRNASAPGGATRGEANVHVWDADNTSVPPNADIHTVAALKGYAVLVRVPAASDARIRRRLYLSLHSAQRAVERAEERGLEAHLLLVRMTPEGVVAP